MLFNELVRRGIIVVDGDRSYGSVVAIATILEVFQVPCEDRVHCILASKGVERLIDFIRIYHDDPSKTERWKSFKDYDPTLPLDEQYQWFKTTCKSLCVRQTKVDF